MSPGMGAPLGTVKLPAGPWPCDDCSGHGDWAVRRGPDLETVECDACRGTGHMPCAVCGEDPAVIEAHYTRHDGTLGCDYVCGRCSREEIYQ